MIEKKINSIRFKDYSKFSCPELEFNNYCEAMKIEIKGDGIKHEEQISNKASMEALLNYKDYLNEQQRLLKIYISNFNNINEKNELYIGKTKYQTC